MYYKILAFLKKTIDNLFLTAIERSKVSLSAWKKLTLLEMWTSASKHSGLNIKYQHFVWIYLH